MIMESDSKGMEKLSRTKVFISYRFCIFLRILNAHKEFFIFLDLFFMKSKAQSGREGEDKAIVYLEQKGWKVIAKNYRYKRGELDIIGMDGEVLVFVEVKYRKNNLYGFPENFVNNHKVGMMRKTAMSYIFKENWKKNIRFDIVAITGEGEPEHFQDAF